MPVTRAKKRSEDELKASDAEAVPEVTSTVSKSKRRAKSAAPLLVVEKPEVPSKNDDETCTSSNITDNAMPNKRGRKRKTFKASKPISEESEPDTDINLPDLEPEKEIKPKKRTRKTINTQNVKETSQLFNVTFEAQKTVDTEPQIDLNSTFEVKSDERKNKPSVSGNTPLKRENTYTIIETSKGPGDVSVDTGKKLVFKEASPCRLFKKSNVSGVHTPQKTICSAVSFGSAGKTPMPPPDKSESSVKPKPKLPPWKKSLIFNDSLRSPRKPISSSSPRESMKTPPKMLCRAISVGSAGRTPMPPKKPSIPSADLNPPKMVRQSISAGPMPPKNDENNDPITPKDKVRVLNVTHSVEKKISVKPTSPVKNAKTTTRIPLRMPNRGLIRSNKNIISRGITKNPKKAATISEAKSKQIASLLRTTYNQPSTPLNLLKPVQPLSKSKMPNFASLHKKQFEQMESLVENKARKEERAKKLLAFNTPSSKKDAGCERNASKPEFAFVAEHPRKFPNVSYKDSPQTKLNVSKIKEQLNSVDTKSEKRNREHKDYIVGVRTNRRFRLQMKARNIT